MPPFRLRPGPIGLALTLADVWRRLPPKQRKQLLAAAREHGPKVAKLAAQQARRKRR
jgi:TRAP-type C4-dicarboxylate transport system substrate-binding protein